MLNMSEIFKFCFEKKVRWYVVMRNKVSVNGVQKLVCILQTI